ncbi:MAG TPA: hypothetical protein VN696_05580 [Pyrinomonadaceae bacterium]|nr:hypothetical protein [Pyrinomonadaceae bacterium]
MKMRAVILFLSLSLSISTCANHAAEKCADEWIGGITSQTFPGGTGVNIHFTDAQPGEIKMIAGAGFRWVRMDFVWAETERQRGVYDFSAYDRLLAALDQNRLNALFILDYGNPLYTKDKAVRTEEGRQAFTRWALAAAKHFGGRGAIWELFNEPNNKMFWPPAPNVDEYITLALMVGHAFRSEAPNEKLVGPATGLDFPFLESCFKAGLLDYWSAVSVHPYRDDDPENAATEYCRLRKLIRDHNRGKEMPIISSEWGYSSAWPRMNEQQQAAMLTRELLTNVANGIPISIWYDWRDDGGDANEGEHHFGIVRQEFRGNSESPFEPKPAYFAAKTVNSFLNGSSYQKRISTTDADDFVLVFSDSGRERIAAWTTASRPRQVLISLQPGSYTLTKSSGEKMREVSVGQNGLTIELATSPIFLWPLR